MNITQKIGQWGDLHHPKIPGACTPVFFLLLLVRVLYPSTIFYQGLRIERKSNSFITA